MSTSLRFEQDFSLAKTSFIIEDLCNGLRQYTTDVLPAISRDNLRSAVEHSVSYGPDRAALAVKIERQMFAFYQKNAAFDLGIDTKQVAIDTFLKCEAKCAEVNQAMRARVKSEYYNPSLLHEVSYLIGKILGDVPSFEDFDFGFGPGSNVGCTNNTSIRRKLHAVPTLTPTALPYLSKIRRCFPQWTSLQYSHEVTPVGRFAVVPKNAKTDRPINVEPILNSVVQKGIGSYIRDRLLREGINLRDQSRNQKLARQGSIDGSFCTIDLASASDTISLGLVRDVLSYEWFDLLYAFRTHSTELPDGTVVPLEKFSSMGNAYTFELESLIFYAITRVICGRKAQISVYGDDIICPTEHYDSVCQALESCGFSVNSAKSFAEGPFRESCGRDYFGGISVRPCYLKGLLSVKELFRFHNFFFREGMHEMCSMVLKYIPKRFRTYGPDGFGDGHLLSDDHPATYMKRNGNGSYIFVTWCTKPRVTRDKLDSDYEAWLYLVSSYIDRDVDPYSVQTADFFRRQNQRIRALKMTPADYSRSIFFERPIRGKPLKYSQTRVMLVG